MLALRPAFEEADRSRLIKQVLHEVPPRLRKLDPRIPRDLETVVLKATAKEPGSRYASAAELAEDLRRFLVDRPIRARRASALERAWRWGRRNPVVAGLTAALALAVAGGFGGILWNWLESVRQRNDALRARDDAGAQREKAETNLRLARRAVDEMYTQVAQQWLAHQPRMEPK